MCKGSINLASKRFLFLVPGSPASVSRFWSSSAFRLEISGGDNSYESFLARNSSSVMEMYSDYEKSWLPMTSTLPWKTKDTRLNPFEESCLGVLTTEEYSVTLQQYRVNFWLVRERAEKWSKIFSDVTYLFFSRS